MDPSNVSYLTLKGMGCARRLCGPNQNIIRVFINMNNE